MYMPDRGGETVDVRPRHWAPAARILCGRIGAIRVEAKVFQPGRSGVIADDINQTIHQRDDLIVLLIIGDRRDSEWQGALEGLPCRRDCRGVDGKCAHAFTLL